MLRVDVINETFAIMFDALCLIDVASDSSLFVNVSGSYVNKVLTLSGGSSTAVKRWSPLFIPWLSAGEASVTIVIDASSGDPYLEKINIHFLADVDLGDSIAEAENFNMEYKYTTNGTVWIVSSYLHVSWQDLLTSSTQLSSLPSVLSSITSADERVNLTISNADTGTVKHGITLMLNATIGEGQILKTVGSTSTDNLLIVNSDGTQAEFICSFYIPLFRTTSTNLTTSVFSLTLNQRGRLYLTSWLASTGLSISVVLNKDHANNIQSVIASYFNLRMWPNGDVRYVDFTVNSTYDGTGYTLNGLMSNPWLNPFGISWLTLTNSSIYLRLVPVYLNGVSREWVCQRVSMSGGVVITSGFNTFTSTLTMSTLPIALPAPNKDGIIVTQNTQKLNDIGAFRLVFTINATNSLPIIIKTVLPASNVTTSALNMVNSYNGYLLIVYSMYADSQYPIGLTCNATVTVNQFRTPGVMVPATFDMLVAIPSAAMNITPGAHIMIQSHGIIYTTASSQLMGLKILFDYSKDPLVAANGAVTASLIANDTHGNKLIFELDGYISHSTDFQLSGSLITSWDNVFGISWMKISGALLSFELLSNKTTHVGNFNAGLDLGFILSYGPPLTLTASASISNDFSQFTIDTDFLIGGTVCLSTIVQSVTPKNVSTAVLHDFVCAGQDFSVSMFIANTVSAHGPAGLYLNSLGSISSSGTGQLTQLASHNFGNNATSHNFFDFYVAIYLPVFTPSIYPFTLSLQSKGITYLSDNLYLAGTYASISVPSNNGVISYKFGAILDLSLSQSLIQFQVSGTGIGGTGTLEGSIMGLWNQPFGKSWLVGAGGGVSVTLDNKVIHTLATYGHLNLAGGGAALDISYNASFTPSLTQYYIIGTCAQSTPITSLIANALDQSTTVSSALLAEIVDGVASQSFTIAISNYNAVSASVSQGLNVTYSASLYSGLMFNALNKIIGVSTGGQISTTVGIYVPIFDAAMLPAFHLKLAPATSYSGVATITNLELYVQVQVDGLGSYVTTIPPSASQSSLIVVEVAFNVSLPSSGPVHVVVDGSYSGYSQQLSLSGSVPTSFHPFGLSWLELSDWSATVVLDLASTSLAWLNIEGNIGITLGEYHVNIHTAGFVNPSQDLFYMAVRGLHPISGNNSIVALGQKIMASSGTAGKPVFAIGEVLSTITIDLVVANTAYYDSYYKQTMPSGVTLLASVPLSGGHITNTLTMFGSDVVSQTFSIGVSLPVFTTDPGFEIWFSTPGARITNTVYFTSVQFLFASASNNVEMALNGGILITPKSNGPLLFQVTGTCVFPATEIIIGGAMTGIWTNAFGLNNFNIGNVTAQIGFDAALCPVTACVSELALGGALQWYIPSRHNTTTFHLYGLVDAVLGHLFFSTSLSSSNSRSYALSLTDVVSIYNYITGSELSSSVVPDVGIYSFEFSFASYTGTVGAVSFHPGFAVSGSVGILGFMVSLAITATSNPVDFTFNFALDATAWCAAFRSVIDSFLPSVLQGFFKICVDSVSLTGLSLMNLEKGIGPTLSIVVNVFGIQKTLTIQISIFTLALGFATFFALLIK